MTALGRQMRAERARVDLRARPRSAEILQFGGRREFHSPTVMRHVRVEQRLDPLHWLIGLVILGSFVGALYAAIAA